jgi:tetratricopeptide (TPR) repeat protein
MVEQFSLSSIRRFALCIGIGHYTKLSNHDLRYAVADAHAVSDRLCDPQRGIFEVTLLTEPDQTTKTALDRAFESHLQAADQKPEDLVIIYLSCHGQLYRHNHTLYFLPSDAEIAEDGTPKKSTVFDINDLTKMLSGVRVNNILFLLDVCHSGGSEAVLQHLELNLDADINLFLVGAARQDQVARQSSHLQHGIFTHCLLRAFDQRPSSRDWLTMYQIVSFVSDEIQQVGKDTDIKIQITSVSTNPNLPVIKNPFFQDPSLLKPTTAFLPLLPPIWNVPYRQNPFFLGREALLSRLGTALRTTQATKLSQPQAITGLGGIGKTQLAVEYAYRFRLDYHAVLWVSADTRDTLSTGFIELGRILDLPEKNEREQGQSIAGVQHWLQTHRAWLLILDNADDLSIVDEFLPRAFQGHLLLTTRASAVGLVAKRIEVDTLDLDTGSLLLLRRAKVLDYNEVLDQAGEEDRESARQLYEELGGLPLALDQAGAFIEETQCGLQEYLRLYHLQRAEVLNLRGEAFFDDHPQPVTTTWSLSFAAVEQRQKAAADLLRVCAFLHPDAIPEELFGQAAVHLSPALAAFATNPLAFNTAFATVNAYSLLHRNSKEKMFSVHRLVQAVLQDTMTEQERILWIERVLKALDAVFPDSNPSNWSQCTRLVPHALVCTTSTQSWRDPNTNLASLLFKTAHYLVDRAQYTQAEPLYQRALHIWEQVHGPDHPNVAYTLNNLAELYRDQSKYAQAELLYQRALHIFEQTQGPEHPDVAYPLHNLANLYREQGRYTQAEPLYQRALHIWEQAYGPDHPRMAAPLNGLAVIYYEQGQYTQAEPLYQRALHIFEQTQGPEHPDVAYPLNGLANLYREQGRYTQAEPLYQRALHIREQRLGSHHPETAEVLHDFALLQNAQGNIDDAISLCKRALTVREQALGSNHPKTRATKNSYIDLLQAMDRQQEKSEEEWKSDLEE